MQKLKWTLLVLLANLSSFMTGNAASAVVTVSPLSRVCAYVQGDTRNLKATDLEYFKTNYYLNKNPEALQVFCKGARPIITVGQMQMYRNGNIVGLFLMSRDHDFRDLMFSRLEEEFTVRQAMVTMDDGVQIPTYTFAANSQGAAANHTVLDRSPYMSDNLGPWWNSLALALRGVNVVLQPNRGTFMAGGEFEWLDWKQEAKDGRATVDWIIRQPWSNKKVFAYGVSYSAFSAMALATARHPNVLAVFAGSGPWNPSTDSVTANGFYGPGLTYTAGLNWDGDSDNRQRFVDIQRRQKNRSYAETLNVVRSAYGLRLKSLSPTELNKKSDDFIAALKQATAVMVYSYGVRNDQDSRDVINLRDKLKGMPNHYFIMHDDGHDGKALRKVLIQILNQGDSSPENIGNWIHQNLFSDQQCLYFDKLECKDDISKYIDVINHETELKDLNNAGKAVFSAKVMETTAFKVYGQRKYEMTIEVAESAGDTVMKIDSFVCDAKNSCDLVESERQGTNKFFLGLKKGIHTYTLTSQSEYFDMPEGKLWLNFTLRDQFQLLPDKKVPHVRIKSFKYIIPIKI